MTIKDTIYPQLSTPENGSRLDDGSLLNEGSKSRNSKPIIQSSMEKNGNLKFEGTPPPDGGPRAWSIMIASFLVNGILFGIINSFSPINSKLSEEWKDRGDPEHATKAALVGSLTMGTTFFLSMLAGIMTDLFGIQMMTFAGGAIAALGVFIASFYTDQYMVLYLTYGVMYGLGASLAYTPSLVILGHYFKRYLGIVNGVVTCGSSIFTMIMAYSLKILVDKFGLNVTFKIIAAFTAVVMCCAILFKPIPMPRDPAEAKAELYKKKMINFSLWKKKKYVVWACSIPVGLFGYFVPYVHMGQFIEHTFGKNQVNGELPIICLAVTSGVGRLIFGYIADLPRVDRILLQQISFISIGLLTMCLAYTKTYYVIILITLGMGLFDGCFISLLGPIAFDICGHKGATQAIGFLLAMCSVPLTVGPPAAAWIFGQTGSFHIPFILAGIPPVVGALVMFLIKLVKDDTENERTDGDFAMAQESLTDSKWQNG